MDGLVAVSINDPGLQAELDREPAVRAARCDEQEARIVVRIGVLVSPPLVVDQHDVVELQALCTVHGRGDDGRLGEADQLGRERASGQALGEPTDVEPFA